MEGKISWGEQPPQKTYLHYIGKKTIWFYSLLKMVYFFFIYKTQNTKNSALNDTYTNATGNLILLLKVRKMCPI